MKGRQSKCIEKLPCSRVMRICDVLTVSAVLYAVYMLYV